MFLLFFRCIVFVFEILLLLWGILCALIENIKDLFVSKQPKSIANEIVLITGAGHGLGKEMALYIAQFKPILVLWDTDQANVERTANEIKRRGGIAYAYKCDVSDNDDVQRTANKVRQAIGTVYMVINNAGILHCNRLIDLSPEKIERTFRVNILSQFWTSKAFLIDMLDKRRGHIVAISSNRGLFGRAFFTDYSATKFGIIGFMQALYDEIRSMGVDYIHFTTICPSAIDTGLSRPFETRFPSIFPILEADYAAKYIIDRVLQNEFMVIFPIGHKLLHYVLRDSPLKIYNLITDFIGYSVQPSPIDYSI